MLYLVNNIKLSIDKAEYEEGLLAGGSEASFTFKKLIAKEMGVGRKAVKNFSMYKRSIDARERDAVKLVYSFVVESDCSPERVSKSCKAIDVNTYENFVNNRSIDVFRNNYYDGTVGGRLITGERCLEGRPVIVGAGPAGLFCAYFLAVCGMNPLVVERGERVEQRIHDVQNFFDGGRLNTSSNVQFGEGGAGTFSDGKLTTRINDVRCNSVLEVFVDNGAPEEIKYQAMPHIGTDRLREIIPNIRRRIESLGGQFLFNTTVVDIKEGEGSTKTVVLRENHRSENTENSVINTNCLVLAIGHSARDTFEMLFDRGFAMQQKAFSVGTRIEHRQSFMDEAQFGKYAGNPLLGPAVYKLYTKGDERTAYTFCMCPGGKVVAATSENGMSVVNGMSEYARDGENCNSALVVSVDKADFEGSHPLAGVRFQQSIERKAYEAVYEASSDSDTFAIAPTQNVAAFLDDRVNTDAELAKNQVQPSYQGVTVGANLNAILPKVITDKISNALNVFDKKIRGFAHSSTLLTGVETRTSSPVRILRNDNMEAIGKPGVFPVGEGPGYAGGIMSAAVDGIKAAEQILCVYRRKK